MVFTVELGQTRLHLFGQGRTTCGKHRFGSSDVSVSEILFVPAPQVNTINTYSSARSGSIVLKSAVI